MFAQVFDKFSATLDIPLEIRFGIPFAHSELPYAPRLTHIYRNKLGRALIYESEWHWLWGQPMD
jgi:hypothetical protein